MSIFSCPECGKKVSDQADRCPHCGLPQKYLLEVIKPTNEDVQNYGDSYRESLTRIDETTYADEKEKTYSQQKGQCRKNKSLVFLTICSVLVLLCSAIYFFVTYTNNEDVIPFRMDDKCGFMNLQGQIVIANTYEDAGKFSDGLAPVKVDGKYGYINTNNEIVIPCIFDYAFEFSQGLAMIVKNGKYGYINEDGVEVIPTQYDEVIDFYDGFASVCDQNGKWGYINKNGDLMIPYKYDIAGNFSEGLAVVKEKEEWCIIDSEGKVVTTTTYNMGLFDQKYSEGLFCVKDGDKYGYIDKNGEMKLSYYDEASSFSDGLAVVKIGDKYGYINKNGDIIIQPKYEYALSFINGLAYARTEYYQCCIDVNGNEIYTTNDFNQSINWLSNGLITIYPYGIPNRGIFSPNYHTDEMVYFNQAGEEITPHF